MVSKIHAEFMNVVNKLVERKVNNEKIIAAILGGSVARGDETEHSDIDIVFYVRKKDMPLDSRRFYKYLGKYIEEHYLPIEGFRNDSLLPEEKIIYDKTEKLKEVSFDEKKAKKIFKKNLSKAKKSLKLTKEYYFLERYEESFYCLFGIEGPTFILMHSLPPRFNLPFPSFRLLESLKIIDKSEGTKFYNIFEKIYTFENKDSEKILKIFSKAYKLVGEFKKNKNPPLNSLGFYDKIKIKYNLEGLKRTFDKYPFVYAYRFMVGCLVMWSIDKKLKKENRKILENLLLEILGIRSIDEVIVSEKIELTNKLIKECNF